MFLYIMSATFILKRLSLGKRFIEFIYRFIFLNYFMIIVQKSQIVHGSLMTFQEKIGTYNDKICFNDLAYY
jgi:hypothetical protein